MNTRQITRSAAVGLLATHPILHDLGLLWIRLVFGLTMAFAHGFGKIPPSEQLIAGVAKLGFYPADFFAWCAGLSEFVGGLLLALGLLTRPAGFFMAFTMAVAFFVVHADDPFFKREPALLFGAAALVLMVAGPGRFSVDEWLRRWLGFDLSSSFARSRSH